MSTTEQKRIADMIAIFEKGVEDLKLLLECSNKNNSVRSLGELEDLFKRDWCSEFGSSGTLVVWDAMRFDSYEDAVLHDSVHPAIGLDLPFILIRIDGMRQLLGCFDISKVGVRVAGNAVIYEGAL